MRPRGWRECRATAPRTPPWPRVQVAHSRHEANLRRNGARERGEVTLPASKRVACEVSANKHIGAHGRAVTGQARQAQGVRSTARPRGWRESILALRRGRAHVLARAVMKPISVGMVPAMFGRLVTLRDGERCARTVRRQGWASNSASHVRARPTHARSSQLAASQTTTARPHARARAAARARCRARQSVDLRHHYWGGHALAREPIRDGNTRQLADFGRHGANDRGIHEEPARTAFARGAHLRAQAP